MTPEQRELLAKSIHDAYAQFHVNRYKIDFTTWEETSQLEKQMYRFMAEGAYKTLDQWETVAKVKALLQGYRGLTALGRITPILQEGNTMSVDWFAEYHALEAKAREVMDEPEKEEPKP